MKILRKNEGFTLIETVIYVAIVGLIATALVAFALTVRTAGSRSVSIAEVNTNAQFIMDVIERNIREAESVVTPTKGNSDTAIELDIPQTGDNRVITLSGTDIELVDGSNPGVALNSSLVEAASLTFTNNSQGNRRDSISISLTLRYFVQNNPEFAYSKTYETTITRRK